MTKEQLRREYRQLRQKQFSNEMSKKIFEAITCDEAYKSAQTVMMYVSLGSEVSTLDLILHAALLGKKICVPKVFGNYIRPVYIDGLHDLQPGAYGISEPISDKYCEISDIDLILVPGICFDTKGNRIGYGKGFYDRLLKDITTDSIGLCYDFCVVDSVFPEEFDIAVQTIITDKRRINCRK